MNKLYLITGPAGVGKSTISKALAEKLEKSVLIEGDDIYNMVISGYVSAWKKNNHLNFFWKNVTNLIQNGLDEGYDVVFNYIISKKDYEMLVSNIKNAEIIFKVLITSEEELLKRDKLRKENCQMNERCLILLDEFKKGNFDLKDVLDTTNLTIEETLRKVIT